MKTIILSLFMAGAVLAQNNGSPVQVVAYPSSNVATRLFYDGSGNLIYQCLTSPNGPWNNNSVPAKFSWTVAGSTLTSISVTSNVATATTSTNHGLAVGNQVVVTGSATTGVNGTFVILTVPSATTFTYTDTVANGTYTDTGLALTTNAPRSTAAIWSIEQFVYVSSNLDHFGWADSSSKLYTHVCDSRATYYYQ